MNKHCKNCKYHHNAGHPKEAKNMQKFNDWCVKQGGKVNVSHCKTMKLKELNP